MNDISLPARSTWTWLTRATPRPSVIGASLLREGVPATMRDVVQAWRDDAGFRSFWTAALRDIPFEAYCWELPPVDHASFGRPFECVFIDSAVLAGAGPDAASFAEHFERRPTGDEALVFPNLGGDALLVAPCPRADAAAYTHLAAFLRRAPPAQAQDSWRVVAHALVARLSDAPTWLSTCGLGVYWLHFRLDSTPKYYQYLPYKSADPAFTP